MQWQCTALAATLATKLLAADVRLAEVAARIVAEEETRNLMMHWQSSSGPDELLTQRRRHGGRYVVYSQNKSEEGLWGTITPHGAQRNRVPKELAPSPPTGGASADLREIKLSKPLVSQKAGGAINRLRPNSYWFPGPVQRPHGAGAPWSSRSSFCPQGKKPIKMCPQGKRTVTICPQGKIPVTNPPIPESTGWRAENARRRKCAKSSIPRTRWMPKVRPSEPPSGVEVNKLYRPMPPTN